MQHGLLHWQPFRNAEKDEGDERLPRSIEESRRRLVDAKRGRNERPFKRTSVPFAYRCALRNRLFVRLNRSFVRDALRAKAGDFYTYRQASSKKDGRNRKGELLWRLPSKR